MGFFDQKILVDLVEIFTQLILLGFDKLGKSTKLRHGQVHIFHCLVIVFRVHFVAQKDCSLAKHLGFCRI